MSPAVNRAMGAVGSGSHHSWDPGAQFHVRDLLVDAEGYRYTYLTTRRYRWSMKRAASMNGVV